MTIVERISASNLDKSAKIVKLWLVVMLNYRQPLSDAAWDAMRELTDADTVDALAFISGYATGAGLSIAVKDGSLEKGLTVLLNEKGDW